MVWFLPLALDGSGYATIGELTTAVAWDTEYWCAHRYPDTQEKLLGL